MAYHYPRKPPAENVEEPVEFPGPQDVWETIKAPLAGLWQGIAGRNLNWEQYVREKARRNRGYAPSTFPKGGPVGWLARTMRGTH